MFIFKDFIHTSYLEDMFAVQISLTGSFSFFPWFYVVFFFSKKCAANLMGVIHDHSYGFPFRIHSLSLIFECISSIWLKSVSFFKIQICLAVFGAIWIWLCIFSLIFGNVHLLFHNTCVINSILYWLTSLATFIMFSFSWISIKMSSSRSVSFPTSLFSLI